MLEGKEKQSVTQVSPSLDAPVADRELQKNNNNHMKCTTTNLGSSRMHVGHGVWSYFSFRCLFLVPLGILNVKCPSERPRCSTVKDDSSLIRNSRHIPISTAA